MRRWQSNMQLHDFIAAFLKAIHRFWRCAKYLTAICAIIPFLQTY